jgi:hypothetical protein
MTNSEAVVAMLSRNVEAFRSRVLSVDKGSLEDSAGMTVGATSGGGADQAKPTRLVSRPQSSTERTGPVKRCNTFIVRFWVSDVAPIGAATRC